MKVVYSRNTKTNLQNFVTKGGDAPKAKPIHKFSTVQSYQP